MKICAVLVPPAKSSADDEAAALHKILFIRIDRIGDMVLSTPTLRAIKHAFPGAELTVLAGSSNAPLLRHDPYVDRVLVWNATSKKLGPIRFLRKAHDLRAGGYDAVIDPMTDYNLGTALLAGLSRAPIRIGYPGYGREVFFNRHCSSDDHRHMVDLVRSTAQRLGAEAYDRQPHLHLLPAERLWARRWLSASRLADRPVVAVHPGAHYRTQRWPADHYVRLVQSLVRDHRLSVLLLGGPADREVTEPLRVAVGERVGLFTSPDLRRAAALIAEADALVCNNSGPLHIAAALGVPTLSFMGPTVKAQWMPIGDRHVVLRANDLDCIGCNRGTCERRDHACMRAIAPEFAVSAVLRLLQPAAGHPSDSAPEVSPRITVQSGPSVSRAGKVQGAAVPV